MASGRRERKKRETRRQIVDEAVALFAAHGYEATTMDDIAEAVDVSRATVFNFFPRKADLVLAWFGDRRAEVATRLEETDRPDTGIAVRLTIAFRAIANVFDRDPQTGRAMVRAWLHAGGPLLTPESDTARIFADTIRVGQRRGEVVPGIDAELVGRLLFDVYLGVLYRWMDHHDADTGIEDELLASLDVLLTGILAAGTARGG